MTGTTGATGATGLGNGTAVGNTTYWNGSTWVVNNANIFNNGANVGIGTINPIVKLHVADNTSTIIGAQTSHATNLGAVSVVRTRGTVAAPTAVQANDGLGSFEFGGYTGTGIKSGAYIRGIAAENYSGSVSGTYMTFNTTTIGSNVTTERMRITDNGKVGIGTPAPGAGLTISAPTTWESAIGLVNTAGSGTEWRITSDTDGGLKFVKVPGATLTAMAFNPTTGAVNVPSLAPGGTVVADGGGTLSVVPGAPLTGTGTPNFFPKWNGAGTALTPTSILVDNGTTLGVGISTPSGPGRMHVFQNMPGPGQMAYFEHQTSTNSGGINTALYAISTASGTANNWGVYAQTNGTGAQTIGVEASAINTGATGGARGIDAVASVSGSGEAIGIFADASGSPTNNWAGFFNSGNVYVANRIKVGAGTTPNYAIDINAANYGMYQTDGTIQMATYVGNGGPTGGSIGTITNHPFFIYTAASGAKLTVLPNGNVGIGNVGASGTPGYKLHVTDGVATIVSYNENTFSGSSDGTGVYGRSVNAGGYGYGAQLYGGYYGAFVSCTPAAYSSSTYGIGVSNSGGTAGTHFGINTTASGTGTNFGLYSTTSVSAGSYAIYSNGSQFSTTGSAWTVSDRKLKKDITDLTINATETISKIKVKQYYYDTEKYKGINLPSELQWGFIAQDMEEIIPGMVKSSVHPAEYDSKTRQKLTEEIELKAIQYDKLFPLLIKSAQEQQAEIDELKKIVEAQQKQIQQLLDSKTIEK